MSIISSPNEESLLLSLALSSLAAQGKVVSLDHDIADYMGVSHDPALSAEPPLEI